MLSREYWHGSVRLADREVAYTVRVSSRAKNVRLRVGIFNGLEIIVPQNFDRGGLGDVFRKNQNWILDKLNHYSRLSQNLQQGISSVLYRGRAYAVETRISTGAAYDVVIDDEKIIVIMPDTEVYAGLVLERWFKYLARDFIYERIGMLNQNLKLSFNKVFIKDQKTRWGSCSRQKNLNFNWRLIMAPVPVLDYVIIHELMHLIEPNHSKRFWALVEELCPDYKERRAWLRKNGRRLALYPT